MSPNHLSSVVKVFTHIQLELQNAVELHLVRLLWPLPLKAKSSPFGAKLIQVGIV